MNPSVKRAAWVAGSVLAALLAGCAAPPPPAVARLADGVFVVTHPLRYRIEQTSHVIEVPKGFLTDLASIPRSLWWWQSPIDRSMAGAIVHDYLYWDQSCGKDDADAVLYVAMDESGVAPLTRNLVYDGVRTPMGEQSFKKNGEAKSGGEPRYLSKSYTDKLLDSAAIPNDTLAAIEARARAAGGTVPGLPSDVPALKAACQAALQLFRSRQP